MQKTKISGAAKAFGQNVLQHKPQKLFALEFARLSLSGFAVDILKCHITAVMGDDVFFADHATI